MNPYVIVVDFHVKPGSKSEFRRLLEENARTSCRAEPGCRRFDVLEPADGVNRILLYEIYEDRRAFDHHLASPHFAKFDAESRPHIAAKNVTAYSLVIEGSAA